MAARPRRRGRDRPERRHDAGRPGVPRALRPARAPRGARDQRRQPAAVPRPVARRRPGQGLQRVTRPWRGRPVQDGMLAAPPPDFHLAATPKLYVVAGKVGVGRPDVYVAFRSKSHLHEPRLVLASVRGHHGRTYASRHAGTANCYRSTLRTSDVKAGHTYKVTFF